MEAGMLAGEGIRPVAPPKPEDVTDWFFGQEQKAVLR
jgi:hypothetical protein